MRFSRNIEKLFFEVSYSLGLYGRIPGTLSYRTKKRENEILKRLSAQPIKEPYKLMTQFFDARYPGFLPQYPFNDCEEFVRKFIDHPDVLSTGLHKVTVHGTTYYSCEFFIPNPAQPEFGNLYRIGRVFGDPAFCNRIELEKEGISKNEVARILSISKPFLEEYTWEAVIDAPTSPSSKPTNQSSPGKPRL